MFHTVPLLLIAVCLLASCGNAPPPQTDSSKAPPAASEPFKIASVFPPGPGQEKVMSTCGSCHSLLCATRGQRTSERWEAVKKSHQDKVTGVAPDDVATMFKYLAVNFNDSKPEPPVPAELLQQGCTPF